jgi:Leucine-rich repeat (LRR) protein
MKNRLILLLGALMLCSAQMWGQLVQTAPIYDPGDIAVINAMIANNGLQWTKAPADGSYVPEDWAMSWDTYPYKGVIWSSDAANKRIVQLFVSLQSLTGVLSVSNLTNLQELRCDRNSITQLDISSLTNLQWLECYSNGLTELNISNLSNLHGLYCNSNNLTELDISRLTNLTNLACNNNSLTELDILNLTNLQGLYCQSNSLTKLDISNLTNLQSLYCQGNSLTKLDLSGLNNLTEFSGDGQNCSISLTGNAGIYIANAAFGEGTTFYNTALSYSNGVLTSTNTTASSGFTSPTGKDGMALTGILTMTYPGTPLYNPDDIAVINAMIDNNGLQCTKADPTDGSYVPADWTISWDTYPFHGIFWSDDAANKRIVYLYVSSQSLTGILDVSNLTSLQSLNCSNNSLTELNVSNLTNLQSLYCYSNSLPELNISNLTNLQWLDCSNNNLTALDVSNLTNLQYLYCSDNSLTELDVSNLTNLWNLGCGGNSLTELDVSNLTNLYSLFCGGNTLTELNVSNLANLQSLYCWGNSLTELDVSNLTNLTDLSCGNNSLTELNVSNLANLQSLYCWDNSLTELDVSNLTNLMDLSCGNNSLTELDVSNLTNLRYLYCYDNKLTALDVSNLTNLQLLSCAYNSLTKLDLSGLNNLTDFWGSDQTSSLNLTGSAGNYTTNAAFIDGITFGDAALSYSAGVLTSTSNLATTSGFTSPTGKDGMALTGTLTLTYPDTPLYNPNDIAVINAMIDNNGLQLTKADPADGSYVPEDWTYKGVYWSNDAANKRIVNLYVYTQSLTGVLDVSNLTNLQWFDCNNNSLTELNVSNLTNLSYLNCSNNSLTALNVSNMTGLWYLNCNSNSLTTLDVSNQTYLSYLECGSNSLTKLDLTGLNNLTNFIGDSQTCSLDFTGSASNYIANAVFGDGSTFDNTVLSYSNGVLTSTSKTATTSGFIHRLPEKMAWR